MTTLLKGAHLYYSQKCWSVAWVRRVPVTAGLRRIKKPPTTRLGLLQYKRDGLNLYSTLRSPFVWHASFERSVKSMSTTGAKGKDQIEVLLYIGASADMRQHVKHTSWRDAPY